MPYQQQLWVDGPTGLTPLSSVRLNHMEAGIESATTTAEQAIPLAQKAVANGVATLDQTGFIPDGQIPAGVTRDSELATAIAALVNAAPSTLDTLNELATALGDDPNFATTITNLIATKAAGIDLTAETDNRVAQDAVVGGRAYALSFILGGSW